MKNRLAHLSALLHPAVLTPIFLSLTLYGCQKSEEPAAKAPPALEIAVAAARRADVPLTMEFVGQTKGSVDAEIRARVEGVITAIEFEEGKEVQENQLLYKIDPAPLQAKVAQAQGNLAEARTRLVKAESDLKRVKPLVEMKALSARDLDAAIANEGAASGAVDAAKAALDAAQIELGYCEIHSPTRGIIGLTKAKMGEFVGRAPNPVILNTVSNLDPINVRFAVSEKDYLYFARLKQAEVAAGTESKPRSLTLILADGKEYAQQGTVASIDREIDAKTGSLTVEAQFPNPGKFVRPGQFAKIRTLAETMKGALVVPKRAVRELQGQSQLLVVGKDNTIEIRNVTLGRLVGDTQIVESGLTDGEMVALEALDRLRTGNPVTPKLQQ